jgi:hypothetical protein
MSDSLSERQKEVLLVLCEKGSATPWGIKEHLNWTISKYATARQACEYLTRKGFARPSAQHFTRETEKMIYSPTTFGLLELTCIRTVTDDQVGQIFQRKENRAVFRLLDKVLPDTKQFWIPVLREVWNRVKKRETRLLRDMTRIRSGEEFKARRGVAFLPVDKKQKLREKEDRLAPYYEDLLYLSLELEDEFYNALFVAPFEGDASRNMKSMKRMILSDPQLKQIAQEVIGTQKNRLFLRALHLERLETKLHVKKTTDLDRLWRDLAERFPERFLFEIVDEILGASDGSDSAAS